MTAGRFQKVLVLSKARSLGKANKELVDFKVLMLSLIYSRENGDLNQTFEKQTILFKRT